jgi:hypothetical protein
VRAALPGAGARGRPALPAGPGGAFVPGRFLRRGYTITTRGCPGCERPRLVPAREGGLRCLPVRAGHDILDNNLLAAPRAHVEAVLEMVSEQPAPARFSGGLDSRYLSDWFVRRLGELRVAKDGLWLAYDAPAQRERTLRAVRRLTEAGFGRERIRCYVLVGHSGDTPAAAEERLRATYEAGAMPFAMLWRGGRARSRNAPGWREFVRAWRRPAAIKARARTGWPPIHRRRRRDRRLTVSLFG